MGKLKLTSWCFLIHLIKYINDVMCFVFKSIYVHVYDVAIAPKVQSDHV